MFIIHQARCILLAKTVKWADIVKNKAMVKMQQDEWNTLDLYCHGDTSVHMINGKVMMVLYHSSQLENGHAIPLVKGKIQIQSEGAEVFYKNIIVQPLDAIPARLLKE